MKIYAIILCKERISDLKIRNEEIYIVSDSQAALNAIKKVEINSKLVWDCVLFLKYLATRNNITLVWVPGQNGIEGNSG